MKRITLPLLAGLLLLGACMERELPTALAPEGAAFAASQVGCAADPVTRAAALIQAIADANANMVADVIDLAPGCTYTLTSVNSTGSWGPNGLPIISGDLTINGNGATIERSTAIGTAAFRILQIASGTTVFISGLTISNGNSAGGDFGGGIFNSGTLTLTNSTFSGNSAVFNGGAIYGEPGSSLTISDATFSGNTAGTVGGAINSRGTLTVAGSDFSGNTATFGGGAIQNWGTAEIVGTTFSANNGGTEAGAIYSATAANLTITDASFSGNTVTFSGGAIRNNGAATIVRTTFSANTSQSTAGAIYNSPGSTLIATNVTFSGNSAPNDASALWSSGTAVITSSTFSANTGGSRSTTIFAATEAVTTLRNTIVASAAGATSCFGTITDGGYNLDSGSSCGFTATGSLSNTDPQLGPLALHAPGTTMTHSLGEGSPAIDAGVCTDHENLTVATDQRGVERPQGNACDIGAYEREQAAPPPTPAQLLESLITLSASTPGVSGGTQNKLLEARTHLNQGQIRPACNKLREYIADVQNQRGKKIATADADLLIGRAEEIRTALGC